MPRTKERSHAREARVEFNCQPVDQRFAARCNKRLDNGKAPAGDPPASWISFDGDKSLFRKHAPDQNRKQLRRLAARRLGPFTASTLE